MINAIINNKTKIHGRYFLEKNVDKECDGKRRTQEDEITSIVFSPFNYVSDSDAIIFFDSILGGYISKKYCLDEKLNLDVCFWPKRKNIEPDLMVDIRKHGRLVSKILIEIKWRSGPSGKDQIKKQWYEFLSDEERNLTKHLLISCKPIDMIYDHDLECITWQTFRERLKKDRGSNKLHMLVNCIDDFLERIGVWKFSGFNNIQTDIGIDFKKTDFLFFNHVWEGFSNIGLENIKYLDNNYKIYWS
jgi:hypothetical protein